MPTWCFGLLVMFCVPQEAPPAQAGATFCQLVQKQDVMWSRNDTRVTKQNLDKLFRKGKALCGWGAKN
jgi:hypothetical protein